MTTQLVSQASTDITEERNNLIARVDIVILKSTRCPNQAITKASEDSLVDRDVVSVQTESAAGFKL